MDARVLIDDLPTPCVLVERKRLEQNLRRMQERADANGVRLRPHAKTHKSPAMAQRQREMGARGLTVATVREAETFVRSGFNDIRIAYTLAGRDALRRVVALSAEADVSFCVDTREGAEGASVVFSEAGRRADVLIEIDTGHHRTGVSWESDAAVALARHVERLPGVRLIGLLTHAGHAYHGPDEGEPAAAALRRHAVEERDRMLAVASRVASAGALPEALDQPFELSIGSTPTMAAFENSSRDGLQITEIRPGNYVYCDAMQVALGSAAWEDCALSVLSTVVSKHRDRDGGERVFLDAGKKVLTSDTGSGTTGYGTILYNAATMTPLPHAELTGLSEEHGWVRVRGGSTLQVGDRVRIVPNHACVVVATQSSLYLVEGEEVVDTISVHAR